jgi:hypothetical protein
MTSQTTGKALHVRLNIISLGRITCSFLLFWKAQGGFGNNRWLEFPDFGYKRAEKQSV